MRKLTTVALLCALAAVVVWIFRLNHETNVMEEEITRSAEQTVVAPQEVPEPQVSEQTDSYRLEVVGDPRINTEQVFLPPAESVVVTNSVADVTDNQ